MKKTLIALILGTISFTTLANDYLPSGGYETLETRSGQLTFENGFEHGVPTNETSQKLFDELDYQRAVQGYIWATPIVSFYQWKNDHYQTWGTENGQLVYQAGYESKLGGLTYNTSTPYLIGYMNLNNGPIIINLPDTQLRGAVHNMWQIGKEQMTKPGKYVIYKAEDAAPKVKGATLIAMDTNDFFFGVRLMNKDAKVRSTMMNSIQKGITDINGNPLTKKGIYHVKRGIDHKQPRGMEFWEVVNQAIQANPVQERDRMMMDMLRPLGIEKGKPFTPTPKQQSLLKEAAIVGEAMTKNIDFNKTGRLDHAEYGPKGNPWEIATASTPNQDRNNGMDLDGRAAWFYEAVTNDIAMHGMDNGGWGQVYLDNYYSGEKDHGLDGGKHYTLTIKNPDMYADLFWTITVYNVENRAIIENDLGRADVGSNIKGTVYNKDGSITLHFSPKKPKDVAEANWVQTNEKEGWFVYFRAYSPKKGFVAEEPKTLLPNFEEVK
ncbi:DUF1214 domain-containing protein [Aliivibrio fischeri]|uniref:CDP-4-dehydro-6-deoxy-D-glucose 3-dehydratase n=1 Tax=Aliivibrio fischeri SR5 TaxID=1088719 RepID=A0AAV3EV95_ALIFS|nr:DUF1214 domain-containing protein [Aliivibrio fischeri]EHN70707.1 CDP-4-dehydro-6-deoxy-D-glucose 3-dehydratase [Aliivibrio fischeri SR5]